jgi:hypothetical protein
VLEKNQPKVREGVTEVTVGIPSKFPLGFHFVLGTFKHISESLGGNTAHDTRFIYLYLSPYVCTLKQTFNKHI